MTSMKVFALSCQIFVYKYSSFVNISATDIHDYNFDLNQLNNEVNNLLTDLIFNVISKQHFEALL